MSRLKAPRGRKKQVPSGPEWIGGPFLRPLEKSEIGVARIRAAIRAIKAAQRDERAKKIS